MIGVSLLLILTGGVAGAYLFNVQIAFRRISYLWFLTGANLSLMTLQFAWAFVPSAATAGLLSILIIGMLSGFVFFGAAIYYGSAARSNDIRGSTDRAWYGFVPFVNLWLVFRRGGVVPHPEIKQKTRFRRFVTDPLLVIGAICALTFNQWLGKVITETPLYHASDSSALVALLAKVQTLEESFATEAARSARELPARIDDITTLSAVEANGNTLRMIFDVEQDVEKFDTNDQRLIAAEYCAPEMFAHDLARGGHIVLTYRGPDGRIFEEIGITQAECPQ